MTGGTKQSAERRTLLVHYRPAIGTKAEKLGKATPLIEIEAGRWV